MAGQVPSRFLQNDSDGIETRATRGQCDARLVAILGRQIPQLAVPHVWRVRDDDIVGFISQGVEVI